VVWRFRGPCIIIASQKEEEIGESEGIASE
jgi:hypothetical protein